MIVHRRLLARAPDKAHHRKALLRVGMEQILLIVLRMRLAERLVQPVVVQQQRAQQLAAARQNSRLLRLLFEQSGELRHKVTQSLGVKFAHDLFS